MLGLLNLLIDWGVTWTVLTKLKSLCSISCCLFWEMGAVLQEELPSILPYSFITAWGGGCLCWFVGK